MTSRLILLSSVAVAVLAVAGAPKLHAQTQEQPADQAQADAEAAVAEECLGDVRQAGVDLAQEGYWLTGWGQRWGWNVPMGEPLGPGMAEPVPGETEPPADTPAVPGDPVAPGDQAAQPWAGTVQAHGVASPRHQIRTLYGAAHTLALQGDEDGCQYVLARMQQTAEEHLTELRELGVARDEVLTWREEAMATAMPLGEMAQIGGISMDNLTGVDVRNFQDEYLGSVSDVMVDAQTGEPYAIIVARGGFLGIGEEHVMVPWEAPQAAPNLNALLLDMPEATFDQAPTIDPDMQPQQEVMDEYRGQMAEFWNEQRRDAG